MTGIITTIITTARDWLWRHGVITQNGMHYGAASYTAGLAVGRRLEQIDREAERQTLCGHITAAYGEGLKAGVALGRTGGDA